MGTGSAALQWDGAAWTTVPGPYGESFFGSLRVVWGLASNDVWAGGRGEWAACGDCPGIPGIFHWDGLASSLSWESWRGSSVTSSVVDIWGAAPDAAER